MTAVDTRSVIASWGVDAMVKSMLGSTSSSNSTVNVETVISDKKENAMKMHGGEEE